MLAIMTPRRRSGLVAACASRAWPSLAPSAQAKKRRRPPAPPAAPLERIRATGHVQAGYRIDARPFSYREAGRPTGYSIELCQGVAETVKSELNLPGAQSGLGARSRWTNGSRPCSRHQVDLLCGSMSVTLERRKQVDFSSPIFPGGVGVAVRSDAPATAAQHPGRKGADLPADLAGGGAQHPAGADVRRGLGTTGEQWLSSAANDFQVDAASGRCRDYDAGVKAVLDGKAARSSAERAILLDACARNRVRRDLTVIDRQFTYEPLALARRARRRRLPAAGGPDPEPVLRVRQVRGAYTKWFGKPDETAKNFFRWNALPE